MMSSKFADKLLSKITFEDMPKFVEFMKLMLRK